MQLFGPQKPIGNTNFELGKILKSAESRQKDCEFLNEVGHEQKRIMIRSPKR